MEGINSFLSKFSNILQKSHLKKVVVLESVKEVLGVELDRKDVEIANGVCHFKNQKSAFKNELFIRKNDILDACKKKDCNLNLIDLR